MELWIRNQNKDRLVKCDNIDILDRNQMKCVSNILNNIKIEPFEMDIMLIANDSINLGTYKTKERALEVLDEIQNLLQPKIIYTQKEPIETYELGVYQLKQDVDMKIQEINRIIYEMPQD